MAQKEPKLNDDKNPSAGTSSEPQPNSSEQILADLKAKCEEYLNGWKRERADFLNYKKEEMERMGNLIKYANEELILKILPILDNFYLAEKHMPKNDEFADGFMQIKKQFEDFLSKEGIEAIEVMGKEFNPNTMEATDEVSSSEYQVSGTVVEEVQCGYTMYGKIIRPAKVKISK